MYKRQIVVALTAKLLLLYIVASPTEIYTK